MSTGINKSGLYVDTGLLRDHVSKLREKKKIATRLYENVMGMRNADDPTLTYQYDPILRDIEQLIEYFGRMSTLLSEVGDDAVELSLKLNTLIREDTEYTRYTLSETFLL